LSRLEEHQSWRKEEENRRNEDIFDTISVLTYNKEKEVFNTFDEYCEEERQLIRKKILIKKSEKKKENRDEKDERNGPS